jgi:hypothetical protein
MIVVCNGMQRSGSTLMFNLIRIVLEKTRKGRRVYKRHPLDDLIAMKGDDPLHILTKRHYVDLPKYVNRRSKVRFLFTYRHPVDVAASHLRIPEHAYWDLDQLFETLDRDYQDWQDACALPDLCKTIEYTTLYNDTQKELYGAISWLRINGRGLRNIVDKAVSDFDPRKVRVRAKKVVKADPVTQLRPQHVSATLGNTDRNAVLSAMPRDMVQELQSRYHAWIDAVPAWKPYEL